ncbi:MAG: TIGR03086 family metal-binding protein [Acidimicrobiales bacterium]
MEPTQAMAETNDVVTGLIANVSAEQMARKTPCRRWDVHELVDHMIGGAHIFAAALRGEEISRSSGDAPDFVGDDPLGSWSAAAATLGSAATPDALAATVRLPFGEMPGSAALSLITADHLTHAWDLARSTDQAIAPSDEICDWATQTWGMVITDEMRDGEAFDAAQPVPDGAAPIDRLAAFTGRPLA